MTGGVSIQVLWRTEIRVDTHFFFVFTQWLKSQGLSVDRDRARLPCTEPVSSWFACQS